MLAVRDPIWHLLLVELPEKLFLVKVLFIALSLFMIGLIIYLLKVTDWLKYLYGQRFVEFKSFKTYESVEFVKKWEKVKERLEKGMEKGWVSEAKLAVIEADQLLDDLLARLAYAGDSLGERLDKIDSGVLPNMSSVREAHMTRNDIVHDPDYKLSFDEAKKIISVYGKAFEELQAL